MFSYAILSIISICVEGQHYYVMVFQARYAGNKETIGCGALMKMLLSAAQTLPLHVGRVGERAPPLCGAVPPDPGHVAKAGDAVAALVRVSEKEENWILAEVCKMKVYNTI